MSTLETYLSSAPNARIVRWPFRVLAAVLVIAAVVALVATTYSGVADHNVQHLLAAVTLLPVASLIVRSAGYACLFGRVVHTPMWPFASGTVAFIWVMFLLVASQYA